MNSRRRFLFSLGAASTIGLAGCTGAESDLPVSESPDGSSVNPANGKGSDDELTGREIYFNEIHGENNEIFKDVQGNRGPKSISFKDIEQSLETGFQNGGRTQAIAQALETASQQYQPPTNETYENRHKHILSALHQTLKQKRTKKKTQTNGTSK